MMNRERIKDIYESAKTEARNLSTEGPKRLLGAFTGLSGALWKDILGGIKTVKNNVEKKGMEDTMEKKNGNTYTKVGLSAPWENYNNELIALFDEDEDICVEDIYTSNLNDYDFIISIRVYNHKKFKALHRLLPEEKVFGDVKVKLDIYDMENEDKEKEPKLIDDLETLFNGNPSFNRIEKLTDMTGCEHDFVMFEPEVIQYYNDDLGDFNGMSTCLVQDVARDVFDDLMAKGIRFCTRDLDELSNEDEDGEEEACE